MVVDVRGTVDGREIVFTREPGSDKWSCVVPFDDDSEYVCDLYATDECGNTSYYATVLFQIVHACLRVDMIKKNPCMEARLSDVRMSVRLSDIEMGVRLSEIKMGVRLSNIELVATRCELCGGEL